jgi:hypothetical protein
MVGTGRLKCGAGICLEGAFTGEEPGEKGSQRDQTQRHCGDDYPEGKPRTGNTLGEGVLFPFSED